MNLVKVKPDRKLKRYARKKTTLKKEDEEARFFEEKLDKLLEDFNVFLFSGGDGSFAQFDLRYRRLALADWTFIQPDINWFFNYALSHDPSLHFINFINGSLGFPEAPNPELVQ